jgi:riboflavin kinase/FMN adenylyltransferase
VACIGAFDGLHLGHQALLGHAVARAHALGVTPVALSFEPLPREVFTRPVPPRLMLPRQKIAALWDLGIDLVGLLRFDAAFAAMSAETFVRRVLVERLGVREVWVGPGFRFGSHRGGNLTTLQRLGDAIGFHAGEIDPVFAGRERVSSTRLRELLQDGDFAAAATLLGRPYTIAGRVVRGARLGRKLGFPTANLRFPKVPPLSGIFAARVAVRAPHVQGGAGAGGDIAVRAPLLQGAPAVVSFGTRPTVDGHEPLLEAHLFDFVGDLYGRCIEVEFVARLRDEERFDDLPALVEQMKEDAAQARAILGVGQPDFPAHSAVQADA